MPPGRHRRPGGHSPFATVSGKEGVKRMKATRWLLTAALLGLLAGCGNGSNRPVAVGTQPTAKATEEVDEEAEIQKGLAALSPEDRKEAEAQRFCAVNDDSRLGSMGKPV